MRRLGGYLTPYTPRVIVAIILMTASTLFGVAGPAIIGFAIDDGIHARRCDIDRRLDHGGRYADRRGGDRYSRPRHGDDGTAVRTDHAEQREEQGSIHHWRDSFLWEGV